MPIVLSILLFMSTPGFAAEFKVRSSRSTSVSLSANKVSQPLQCVGAICEAGDDFSLRTIENEVDELDANVDLTQVTRAVTAAVHADIASAVFQYEELLKWLDTAPKIDDQAGIRLFNLWASFMAGFEMKELKSGKIVVDEKIPPSTFKLTPEQEKRLILLRNEMENFLGYEFPTKDINLLQKVWTEQRLHSEIDRVIADVEKMRALLEGIPQIGFISQLVKEYSPEELRKEKAKGIDSDLLDTLEGAHFIYGLLGAIVTNKKMNTLSHSGPIDIQKFALDNDVRKKIRDNIAKLKSPDYLNAALDACTFNAVSAKVFLLKNADLPKLAEYVDKSKAEFIKALDAGGLPLSPVSRKSLGSVSLYTQNTVETSERILFKLLEDNRLESQQNIIETKQVMASAARNNMFALTSVMGADPAHTNKIEELCLESQSSPLPDQSLGDLNLIRLGQTAVRWPGKAKKIAFHELAHIYQRRIEREGTEEEKKWLDDRMTCLRSLHPKRELTEDNAAEDFADMISTLAPEKSNVACFFVHRKEFTPMNFDIVQKDESDEHSSAIFRIVHADYIQNGTMRPECEPLFKDHPPLKNCLTSKPNTSGTRSRARPSTK